MFAATATGSTRAPFLPDMAADLSVSLPAVANLFGVMAACWGTGSYVVGFASDRIGRSIFLIGAPVLLALLMFAAARAQSYEALVIAVALGGLCCGSFTATILAEVSLRTHPSFHGRAFGYVMSGQSLTLLVGVPLAAWLGALVGWRGMHDALALLAICAVVGMIGALYLQKKKTAAEAKTVSRRVKIRDALTGPIVRLFVAQIAERICFGLAAFYYASYLRTTYGLPIEAVAIPLVFFAVGNIAGTMTGGQVADRFPYRRISFAVALVIAGCFALPWFLWHAGLTHTVVLGALFAFFNAVARPPLIAALAEVPESIRGIGWFTAALVGGWFYAGIGFSGFGPLIAVMSLAAALIVVPDSRVRQKSLS